MGERARTAFAERGRVVREVARAGRTFGDGVGNSGRDRHVGMVIRIFAAVERRADVGAVALHLEEVALVCLAVRAELGDAHLGRRLQRVRDRAGRSVTEVRKRAGAAFAQGRRVVREVGRPCRTLGDRVGGARGHGDVEAPAAVERALADVGVVQLDLEAVA